MSLTLVVLCRSFNEAREVQPSNFDAQELIILANPHAMFGGLGCVGNWYLEKARGSVLGLIHSDVRLTPEACNILTESATKNGVSGIVGKSLKDESVIWAHSIQSETEKPVSTLDSCAVFIHKSRSIHFDTILFDSFHLCVEDLCLSARAKGHQVVVPSCDADHCPTEDHEDREVWRKEHTRYRELLGKKWEGVKFSTC